MIHFQPIEPADLLDADLNYIVRLQARSPMEMDGKAVVEKALRGEVDLWRVSGNAKGILVTEIVDGNILWISAMAGSGWLANAKEIVEGFKALAKQFNCKMIMGQPHSRGLRAFYRSFGARSIYEGFGINA